MGIWTGEDPPDFVVVTTQCRTSLEVTQFTTPQFEIFRRKRIGPGSYSSTLRTRRPDRTFWERLRSGTLPDDSQINLHAVDLANLDRDYYAVAEKVLRQKHADLLRYHSSYARHWLLVCDRLSEFPSDFERRRPALGRIVASLAQPNFAGVLLVDGNHHPGVMAVKL